MNKIRKHEAIVDPNLSRRIYEMMMSLNPGETLEVTLLPKIKVSNLLEEMRSIAETEHKNPG